MNSVASSANSMGPMGPFGSGPALGFQPGAQGTNNPNLVILNLGGMQEDKVYNHNIETESGQKIHIQSSMTSQDGNSSKQSHGTQMIAYKRWTIWLYEPHMAWWPGQCSLQHFYVSISAIAGTVLVWGGSR
jgi:hypothetical protein